MLFKRALAILFILFCITPSVRADLLQPIDAEANAQTRNNRGVMYMREKDYFAAIKEFKIAIGVNPNHQTSAVYYNNLGRAYLELAKIQKEHNLPTKNANFASYAQESFESAIKQDCLQLSFYKNLVLSFELQGTLNSKRKQYSSDTTNPFNLIIVALIDERLGNKRNMQIALDDFIASYPKLLITVSLKDYLKMKE